MEIESAYLCAKHLIEQLRRKVSISSTHTTRELHSSPQGQGLISRARHSHPKRGGSGRKSQQACTIPEAKR